MKFSSSCLLKRAIQVTTLSAGLLLVSLSSFAQGNAGRILGAITDQTGGAISGATVTVTDVQRGVARALTTDDSGSFNAPNLTPGTYKVRAEFKGFKAVERDNVLLETGGEVRVDLTLQPGEQTQTITVTEALPLVETTNAELGGTLQSDIVNNLPLNGRNFANLLQLRPGVTIYPGGSGWGQSTNGMRAHDNVYMVDGINGSDPWMAQAVWDSVMASGDTGTLISIDSIDEFKTEENPRAEYGWKPGGIVNVGIKSGTNAVHGTAYAYGRDGAWDARNYFNTAPNPIPSVELEQFGATLGGPIKKDKLFYFLTFEDQRYAVGSTTFITDPITAPGVFNGSGLTSVINSNLLSGCQAALDVGAPGSGVAGSLTSLSAQLAGITVGPGVAGANGIPGAHPNGTCTPAANYPGLFPVVAGNNASGQGANTVPNGLPNTNRIDSGLIKMNYHMNDKNSITGMYYISPGSGSLNDSPSQTNVAWETNQYARSMAFAGNWTFTPSSSVVNEARVGYSHYYQVFLSNDSAQDPRNYGFNGATYHIFTGQTNPLYFGFPGISLATANLGFSGSLGASWPKIVGPDGVLQLTDHISYLRGKHAFKFGGEILNNQSQSNVTASAKGPIGFDSIQDFFNGFPDGPPQCALAGQTQNPGGCPGASAANILTGSLLRNFSYQGYALFFQDDWRIKPRLTLNLGLRYELNTVPKERNNLQANFNPDAPTGLVQGTPYAGDHNNFSPRIGLAYDVFGTGRTVVRAAGGILYEQLSLDVFNGIGNSFGLRANPTGATLVGCSVPDTSFSSCAKAGGTTVITGATGTINTVNIAFGGGSPSAVITGQGNGIAANLPGAGETPGEIPNNWANNSATVPLYSFIPFCGDGRTALTSGPLAGFTPAQCNVMEVQPNLRTPYVADFSFDIQQAITHNVSLDIGYVGNHGTKLISALDINQPACFTAGITPCATTGAGLPAGGAVGPGWTQAAINTCLTSANLTCSVDANNIQAARPLNSKFPYYKYIDYYGNIDTSNYNSLQAVLTMRNYHGLTVTGGYTFSHALGDASDQGTGGNNNIPINSYGNIRSQLYGPTVFDIRQRGTISATWAIPGKKGFGEVLEGWSVNAVALLQTGTPWGTSDTTTDFAGTAEMTGNTAANMGGRWNFYGPAGDWESIRNFRGVTPGPPVAGAAGTGIPFWPGTKNVAAPTGNATCNAQAKANDGGAAIGLNQIALAKLGCYQLGSAFLIPPAYGSYGNFPRLPFRDAGFRNLDFSVTKAFKFKERLTAQFRGEFFNVLNRPEFTNPSGAIGGGGGSLNPSRAGSAANGLGYVTTTPDQAGSNPVLGSGGSRAIQLGLKLIF